MIGAIENGSGAQWHLERAGSDTVRSVIRQVPQKSTRNTNRTLRSLPVCYSCDPSDQAGEVLTYLPLADYHKEEVGAQTSAPTNPTECIRARDLRRIRATYCQ